MSDQFCLTSIYLFWNFLIVNYFSESKGNIQQVFLKKQILTDCSNFKTKLRCKFIFGQFQRFCSSTLVTFSLSRHDERQVYSDSPIQMNNQNPLCLEFHCNHICITPVISVEKKNFYAICLIAQQDIYLPTQLLYWTKNNIPRKLKLFFRKMLTSFC